MNQNLHAPVLAVGIDAAQPALVREMIEQDEMPTLQALLSVGKWLRVESPTNIGSSAVWPTFMTGEEPNQHGVYGEWCWEPTTMSLSRFNGDHLTPFWKTLSETGTTAGILDVPFMPFLSIADGFEIGDWGPHVLLDGGVHFGPAGVADLVIRETPPHPLSSGRIGTSGPNDCENLQKVSSSCLDGVKIRGKLAQRLLAETRPHFSVIVFPETHHAAHYLWHLVEPESPMYDGEKFNALLGIKPTLRDIYREVDRQIGKLLETVGADATVLVFSLQGMRPARGVLVFLEPLMCETGFARVANWNCQTWNERAIDLISVVKRRTPTILRKLYYKTLPPSAVVRLARPTMLPQYDWSQTRAFSLPTDQHGWIRLNLIGREAKGIVPLRDYDEMCGQLEQWLRSLATHDGKPLVSNVIRTADGSEKALEQRIPDLVVHWEDAAFASPLRINGSALELHPVSTKYTSQHSLEGFCIFKGPNGLHDSDTVATKDLHRLIIKSLQTGVSEKAASASA